MGWALYVKVNQRIQYIVHSCKGNPSRRRNSRSKIQRKIFVLFGMETESVPVHRNFFIPFMMRSTSEMVGSFPLFG